MSKAINVAVAAAVGFVAGVLFAPKSGKETREEIKHKAGVLKETATEKTMHVKGAMKDGYQSLREGANQVGGEVSEFADHAKASASALSQDAKTRGSRIADTAQKTTKRAHKDVDEQLK